MENLGMHNDLSGTSILMKAYAAFIAATDDHESRDLLRMLNRDQFELEKLILRRDQAILDRCIRFSQDG